MSSPRISVCVPVYKAEPYIEKCARTLFEQTLDEIEYIFVDDASPDRSIEILRAVLKEYSQRIPYVHIICNKENRGVFRSRILALQAASGQYIIHCDPDDWVSPDMYEKLLTKITETGADMVYCSFAEYEEGRYSASAALPCISNPRELIRAFFHGFHAALWNKLYRREIVCETKFDVDDRVCLCEDMRMNVQMLLRCGQVAMVDEPLYHYNKRSGSITSVGRSYRNMQSDVLNMEFYEKILPDKEFGADIDSQKRVLLLEAVMYNSMPPRQWHTLWPRAKFFFWRESRFTFKLKAAFFCALLSFSATHWLWDKMRQK